MCATCIASFVILKLFQWFFLIIIYSTIPFYLPLRFSRRLSLTRFSIAKSLLRFHLRHLLSQLICKPIYYQSRFVEWLANWISARLLNICNFSSLFLSCLLLPRRTHTDTICLFVFFSINCLRLDCHVVHVSTLIRVSYDFFTVYKNHYYTTFF